MTTTGELVAREADAQEFGERRGTDPHPAERRHSFRVHAQGWASIWHKDELRGNYRLRDLCIEGCSIVGHPRCAIGERVDVALHLSDGRAAVWLSAEVRRSDAGGIGLRFVGTTPRIEDRLQDLVVDAYAREHDHADTFGLVIEPRGAVRSGLVRALDAIGQRVVGIATPLDAVQLLIERGTRVHTAYIGPQHPSAPGFELAEFLARHYPHVHRVMIGDAREVDEAWVAQATGDADAVLELPCSEDALRALVHRISMLPREEHH